MRRRFRRATGRRCAGARRRTRPAPRATLSGWSRPWRDKRAIHGHVAGEEYAVLTDEKRGVADRERRPEDLHADAHAAEIARVLAVVRDVRAPRRGVLQQGGHDL